MSSMQFASSEDKLGDVCCEVVMVVEGWRSGG